MPTIILSVQMKFLLYFFRLTIAAMCALAFVWPFVVSTDPSQPIFKAVAVATLIFFLASLITLLIARLGRLGQR